MIGNIGEKQHKIRPSPAFGNSLLTSALGSGAVTSFFTVLGQNPAWEIAGIDIVTMAAPRTYIDYKQNPNYGVETAFRELTATFIAPFMPGILGMLAMHKRGYGGLYTDSKTLKDLHGHWEKAIGTNEQEKAKDYVKNVFDKVWDKKNPKFDDFCDKLAEKITIKDEKAAKQLGEATELFTQETKTAKDTLIRDTVGAARKVFIPHKGSGLDVRVDSLAKYLKNRSVFALGFAISCGLMMQYINRTITKARTGSGRFAGYKDFGKDKGKEKREEPKSSPGFMMKKLASAGAMMGVALVTMGAFGKNKFFAKGGWNNFQKTIELKGPLPGMNAVKLLVASVFAGRELAARDNTELLATNVRDFFSFFNWLIVGPLIDKGFVHLKDKDLVNGQAQGTGIKKVISWLGDDVSKISMSELKARYGKDTRKMAIHNGGHLIGLGWSLAALGIGVPVFLNEQIINKSKGQNPLTFAEFKAKHKDFYSKW